MSEHAQKFKECTLLYKMDGKKLTQQTQILDVFFLGDSTYMGLIQIVTLIHTWKLTAGTPKWRFWNF